MTPRARQRQFAKLERKVAFAPKGRKLQALAVIQAERLADLRAVAERSQRANAARVMDAGRG